MLKSVRERIIVLLRKSERYFKTDMVYLASGSFWLTVGQIVGTGGGFLLTLAFGNLVSKEVYGNYRYVLSLIGLFGTITLTGISSATTQGVARGFEGTLKEAFRTDLIWSIPSIIATLCGSIYYYLHGNADIALALAISAVGSTLLSAFNLCYSYLQGKHDFKRSTIYGFYVSAAPLLLIPLMLMGYTKSVTLIILVYYIGMVGGSAYSYFRTLAVYHPEGATDPASMPYAFHLSYIAILGRIATYIDSVVVFHFLGAEMLAIYTFAEAPPQAVLRFNSAFQILSLPKLTERDLPTLKKTLPRKIMLHFLATLPVFIAYVIAVPYGFRIFFPQYMDSVVYAQVLGLTLLSAPGVWLGQTLIAHMKKKAMYFSNIINPTVKIALYLTLTPLWGIWGMIAATLISSLIALVVSAIIFRRL